MEKKIFESPLGYSYTKAILDNGLTVYVRENEKASSAYAVFGTRFGSVDVDFCDNGKQYKVPDGIAHYLEHKLFESEEGDAFSLYAKTGASANAYTSFDRTCYLFSCSDKFYENLDILLKLVTTPYFTEETVKKEQGIIGQEIRMYDDSPAWASLFGMLKAMYKNHPVRNDIAGTVETIAEITPELLYKCYECFYNPANMFVCVAGNVDADKIIDKVSKKVISATKGQVTLTDYDEPQGVSQHFVKQQLEVLVPAFCYGYKQNLNSGEVTLKDKVCMSLLLEMLVGDASELYAKLMREGLIGDDFDYEYFTGRNYAAIIFEGESSDPQRVADEIAAQIERLKTDGLDKKLFSAVKCGLYGDAVRRLDSADETVRGFIDCALFGDEFFDEIKLLKTVTADDVYKRLNVFCKDNSVLSVVYPKGE